VNLKGTRCGGVDWIQVAQNCVYWWADVCTVMNLPREARKDVLNNECTFSGRMKFRILLLVYGLIIHMFFFKVVKLKVTFLLHVIICALSCHTGVRTRHLS
jgi:hypothetical protein